MDMAVLGRLFYYTDISNMAQRVTFYIDGFNFYYGLRRTKRNEPQWGDYYWIDMVKLFQGFLGEGQEVEKVVYSMATVSRWCVASILTSKSNAPIAIMPSPVLKRRKPT